VYRIGLAGFVALVVGCGSYGGMKAARVADHGGYAPAPEATSDDGGGGAPTSLPSPDPGSAEIAAEPDATAAAKMAVDDDRIASERPAAGQLTAGVWDDNLNFTFFSAYAKGLPQDQDLGAFGADEQKAARDAFAQLAKHDQLDVQLVLDTTGSMGDELSYLQSEFDSIAAQVGKRFPNLTPRWSLVVYRDEGDEYTTRKSDFTTDTKKFRAQLAAQAAGGGGDFPEAVIAGLDTGLDQSWRDDAKVARVMFWVADAPPHTGEGGKLAGLARRAQKAGVHVYPVASSGIDDYTEYQMRAVAQLTGGRYIFLTDDSGIGNSHAEPHIPCYSVTRLDRAVVRMIESEMSGQRVDAADDDVLRVVGNPDADGKCAIGQAMVVAF
jgi:hypothetical protein